MLHPRQPQGRLEKVSETLTSLLRGIFFRGGEEMAGAQPFFSFIFECVCVGFFLLIYFSRVLLITSHTHFPQCVNTGKMMPESEMSCLHL